MPKPSLPISSLSALLVNRRLGGSPDEIARALMDHGYFRLSGYLRYFQVDPANGLNDFEPGSTMSQVLDIYRADAGLRNLLLEGMAEVEISLRAMLVASLCVAGGDGLEYQDPATYDGSLQDKNGNSLRAKLLQDMFADIDRSKERHVTHHRDKVGAASVPMYVAVEAFSFGTLSRLYGLLADASLQAKIAKRYSYDSEGHFAANIRAVAVFRNACAHHSRIWNREIRQDVARVWPQLIDKSLSTGNYQNTAWGVISVLADMVSKVRRDHTFSTELSYAVPRSGQHWDGLINPSAK